MIWALPLAAATLDAFGAYYQARSAQNQFRSAALDADFQASIANINAREAEEEASFIRHQRQTEHARIGLRSGQERAAVAATTAAAGVQAGVGSAAEVQASMRLAAALEQHSTRLSFTRAENDARGRGVDMRNRSLLARTSARNLRRSASAINPRASAGASLLGSGGRFAAMYAGSSGGGGGSPRFRTPGGD